MSDKIEKILIRGAKIPAIKNKAGLRGMRVYGSRVSRSGPWELVLDLPFRFKNLSGTMMMVWPDFRLEPTRPGGWLFYHWFTYDATGAGTCGGSRDEPQEWLVYELPEVDLGPETDLYEWTCHALKRAGRLPRGHEMYDHV